jgi:hypothetical protein
MIVDDIKSVPFWHSSHHDGRARINGSQGHHCDICPKPRAAICDLQCQSERDKIKDGITVTYWRALTDATGGFARRLKPHLRARRQILKVLAIEPHHLLVYEFSGAAALPLPLGEPEGAILSRQFLSDQSGFARSLRAHSALSISARRASIIAVKDRYPRWQRPAAMRISGVGSRIASRVARIVDLVTGLVVG